MYVLCISLVKTTTRAAVDAPRRRAKGIKITRHFWPLSFYAVAYVFFLFCLLLHSFVSEAFDEGAARERAD